MINTWLTQSFKIKYPIIVAPMFLISNKEMLMEASKAGVMGCIPALNYRSVDEFKVAMLDLKEKNKGHSG